MLWGVKNVKNFNLTIACVQAIGHSFLQIYLYLGHKLVGIMSHQPNYLPPGFSPGGRL